MILRVGLGAAGLDLENPTTALLDRGLETAVGEAHKRAAVEAYAKVERSLAGTRLGPKCGLPLTVTKTSKRRIGLLCGLMRVPVRTWGCAC